MVLLTVTACVETPEDAAAMNVKIAEFGELEVPVQ